MSGYGYGVPPPSQNYYSAPYGGAVVSAPPYGQPQQSPYPSPNGLNPFAALVPSTFPPGTDPNVIACFQLADVDESGVVDDKELQRALSSYNQCFNISTIRLLMYHFTNTNTRSIGTFNYFNHASFEKKMNLIFVFLLTIC